MSADNLPEAAGQFQVVASDPDRDLEEVLAAYADWVERGELYRGRRLTIMTADTTCQTNETVRVDHVLEAVTPGYDLYVMGPKPVFSEYINGKLQGAGVTEHDPADPFAPAEYDGRVLTSPGIDANFAPTFYRFPRPGRYEICWQPGAWRSNTLVIVVAAPPSLPPPSGPDRGS